MEINYAEIIQKCKNIRYFASIKDLYFKEEDYVWILGIEVYNYLRYRIMAHDLTPIDGTLDEFRFMGISVEVSHDNPMRISLCKEIKA